MGISIILYGWILLLVVSIALIIKTTVVKGKIYEFQSGKKPDIPYITLDIQGKSLNMVVDSGCGISIITKEALDMLNYTNGDRNINLSAITSDSVSSTTVNIPFTLNGKDFEESFVVHDAEDFANFQASYGIKLHGLLGNEFLEHGNCKIDYQTHTVTVL